MAATKKSISAFDWAVQQVFPGNCWNRMIVEYDVLDSKLFVSTLWNNPIFRKMFSCGDESFARICDYAWRGFLVCAKNIEDPQWSIRTRNFAGFSVIGFVGRRSDLRIQVNLLKGTYILIF
jgi:hypothetical protein